MSLYDSKISHQFNDFKQNETLCPFFTFLMFITVSISSSEWINAWSITCWFHATFFCKFGDVASFRAAAFHVFLPFIAIFHRFRTTICANLISFDCSPIYWILQANVAIFWYATAKTDTYVFPNNKYGQGFEYETTYWRFGIQQFENYLILPSETIHK